LQGGLSYPGQFRGDRYGEVEDPFGFAWAIATHLEDLTSARQNQPAAWGLNEPKDLMLGHFIEPNVCGVPVEFRQLS